MKTIKIKEWYLNENNRPIEWANMTANMQDYNNPQTIAMYIIAGERGEMQFQTNQQLNAQLTKQWTTAKLHR